MGGAEVERNRDLAFSPLSPNLREAASSPLKKKKSHQKKKRERTLQDPRASAPGSPAAAATAAAAKSPRWLGAEGGSLARLARPGSAAAGWLGPQPQAFQAGAEAEKKRKCGGVGRPGWRRGGPGRARGEGRAGSRASCSLAVEKNSFLV